MMTGKKKNKKRNPGKKAFLFTLSLLFVTLSILSFAKFVFEESEDEKAIFQAAVMMNRLYDIDSSLQRCIKDTFSIYSKVNVSARNSTLIIEEPLPNDADVFASKISKLEKFAEKNDTAIDLFFNDTETLPISILPQDITYSHNFTAREIIIKNPNISSALMKYAATITLLENTTCSWSYLPGDFNLKLEVINPKDDDCNHDNRMISLKDNATITIESASEASNRIIITLSESIVKIKMDQNSVFSVGVKNEFYLKDRPGQAWLTDDIINILFREFGVGRKGGARII